MSTEQSPKYTRGPWAWTGKAHGDMTVRAAAVDSEGYPITVIGGCGCCGSPYGAVDQQEMAANATLIMTSPDLLEALQEIIAAADGEGWSQLDPSFTKARTAIAKALGEPQDEK